MWHRTSHSLSCLPSSVPSRMRQGSESPARTLAEVTAYEEKRVPAGLGEHPGGKAPPPLCSHCVHPRLCLYSAWHTGTQKTPSR